MSLVSEHTSHSLGDYTRANEFTSNAVDLQMYLILVVSIEN